MNEPDICRSIHELIMLHLPEILSLRNTSELKSDHTFVSKGDKLCEKLIFDFLDSNLKDYLVISEETETNLSRLEEVEYVITVDPIDGTENFVSGLKEAPCAHVWSLSRMCISRPLRSDNICIT